MTAEIAQSSRSKPVTTGVVATVLRAFVEIGTVIKSFISASHPASPGRCSESPVVKTEAVGTAQIFAPAEVKAGAGALSPTMNSMSKKLSVDAHW
jgi:hypothetical protein